MNDSQIRQLIQSEIHKTSQSNRFNVQNQGRHIHNDLDSPYVFQPILTYIGFVGYDGSVILLPTGWSITHVGAGEYTITHNLNTQLYAVVVTAQQSTNAVVTAIVEERINDFDVSMINHVPALEDSSFTFILTNINNKTSKLPAYGGNIAS